MNTTTDTPIHDLDGVSTDAPGRRVHEHDSDGPTRGDGQRTGESTRGRLVGAAVIAVIAVLSGVLVAGPGDGPTSPDRGDVAATARLEAQAEQYEQWRITQGQRATTARLEALAAQVELWQDARGQRAATDRLTAHAEQVVEQDGPTRGQQAATDRLAAQAEQVVGQDGATRGQQAATDRLTAQAEAVNGG